ncbi:hypothetical protein GCM10020001_081800 [Nonomuraea salmonea]
MSAITDGSASVTLPRSPSEPSSVVSVVVSAILRARIAPNTRSAPRSPSTKSTRQPRASSASASGNSTAEPYSAPTSTQWTGSRGRGNGRPSGPTRSSVSRARRSASQAVPGPRVVKTSSTVPP